MFTFYLLVAIANVVVSVLLSTHDSYIYLPATILASVGFGLLAIRNLPTKELMGEK